MNELIFNEFVRRLEEAVTVKEVKLIRIEFELMRSLKLYENYLPGR